MDSRATSATLNRILRPLIERNRWAWIAVLIGVLAVYVRTLSPGALGGDPGELQFVPYILGLPHPTGTPLYILLGKLWSALPLGPSVAWRMNLLSAVSATMAAFVLYCTLYERTEGLDPIPRVASSLGGALSLAFGLTFWEQALLADKYAFNALMVALVTYLALRWGRTRSPKALNALALTYGLSLAHHRTMVLFGPPLVGYVLWHEWANRGASRPLWRDPGRSVRLALLFVGPLASYLYLPWAEARGLPPGTWHPRTVREWYDYLFDTGRTGLVYVDSNDLGQMLLFYGRTLWRDWGWLGVLLGIGGLMAQFRRRWADAAFLLLNYLLQAFLAANHHVPRHWVYFIPSFLIYALWVGEGLAGIWTLVGRARFPGRSWGLAFRVAMAGGTLAWPLLAVPGRYRPLREAHLGAGTLDVWRQTLKQGHMADRVGRAIAGVAPSAIIVSDWEQATPLWYYQQVEGLRPDVQIVYPVERLDEAASSGLPLYVARAQAGLADRWRLSCSDSLIALRKEPSFGLPTGIDPLDLRLGQASDRGPTFQLAGYAYGEASYQPATVVPLTLYWRAVKAPSHDYSISLRLFNSVGEQVYQVDSQHPVLGTYPTSRWQAGEVVADYYEIQLARDLPLAVYRWGVSLYRALPEGGWESLKMVGRGEEMAMGGSFQVRGR
jgi:hypothetical protein